MDFHEVANIFPMMQPDEFAALVDDIKRNGQLEPIWVHDNKIIDGRNRYSACIELGITPKTKAWNGSGSLVTFVVSLNLHRRHLTTSQAGMVSLTVEEMLAVEAKERQLASLKQNASVVVNLPQRSVQKSRETAAKMFGVSPSTVQSAKKIQKESPEIAADVLNGKITIHKAKKKIRASEIAAEREIIAKSAKAIEPSDRWSVYTADVRTWEPDSLYDYIITDPPYPREFLPLYGVMAKRAAQMLKPGGLLIAMAGQSYLDQIYAMMSEHMDYYWTANYYTPGQPTPLRHVNVNTTWKPLLMYKLKGDTYKGKIFGDVFTSDGNDKSLHKWGQSLSGMKSIIGGIVLPGQSILDPFCGAGTTGVGAIELGCLFTGLDIDDMNANISRGRLNDTQTK